LCYKCSQYRVNRCVQNKPLLKCAKNHANWFRYFEDVDSQNVVVFLRLTNCIANVIAAANVISMHPSTQLYSLRNYKVRNVIYSTDVFSLNGMPFVRLHFENCVLN